MKLNRRKLLSLIGVSPAVLAGTPALADDKKKKGAAPAVITQPKIEAINPKGVPPAVALVLVTALTASYLPARRAAKLDPVQTLR